MLSLWERRGKSRSEASASGLLDLKTPIKSERKYRNMSMVISWLFLGYFIILFAERAQSLVRICRGSFADLYRSRFDGYVNTLTIISLIATVVMLIFACKGFWQSLADKSVIPDYSM